MRNLMKVFFIKIVRITILSYIGLIILLVFRQRSIIYLPENRLLSEELTLAESMGYSPWYINGELAGWIAEEGASDSALLLTHGNDGRALDRIYLIDLLKEAGVSETNIYILEYPGYGSRPGPPSEASFLNAAEEGFLNLSGRYERIYLAGESIGSGSAAFLAGKYTEDVTGVILTTPFDSLLSVAHRQFPYIPVNIILRDRFDNNYHLSGYSGPVSIVALEEDVLVPLDLSLFLFKSYKGPSQLFVVPGGSCNFLYSKKNMETWKGAVSFLTSR